MDATLVGALAGIIAAIGTLALQFRKQDRREAVQDRRHYDEKMAVMTSKWEQCERREGALRVEMERLNARIEASETALKNCLKKPARRR